MTGCLRRDWMRGAPRDVDSVTGCSLLVRIFTAWLNARHSTEYLRRDWMCGARRDVDGVTGCSVLDRIFVA
jgi:hypothetical protein